jgi:alpha-galactosidase
MGWNDWDSYGMAITEAEFRANVEWFHQHLQPSGWQYVTIDEGWFFDRPDDPKDKGVQLSPDGRFLASTSRFPSAADGAGLKPIADWVHSLGLQFGIHILRGIPRKAVEKNLPIAGSPYHAADAADTSDRCRWDSNNYGIRDNAAGQAYYNSIAQLYAGWGVDFLKVDCISQPYKTAEIHMLSAALKATGRPIVLSLSPGPTPLADAADVVQQAQLWRISDDFWDLWSKPGNETFPQTLTGQFSVLAAWAPYAGPGHWPDADMLPIGYLGPHPGWGEPRESRFTPDETRTLLTLWSIARSPLIVGADLLRMSSATEALLTNPDVIAVDQHAAASQSVLHTADTAVWTSHLDTGREAVAVFNLKDEPATLSYPWSALGLSGAHYRVRDLWQRKDLGRKSSLSVTLPPHASALFSLH